MQRYKDTKVQMEMQPILLNQKQDMNTFDEGREKEQPFSKLPSDPSSLPRFGIFPDLFYKEMHLVQALKVIQMLPEYKDEKREIIFWKLKGERRQGA